MSGFKKIVSIMVCVVLSGISLTMSAEESLDDRIKPVGSVCVEGDACASQTQAAGASDSGSASPETTYNTYCSACHSTGVSGAPIKGDQTAWDERMTKGLDTVIQNAINGINAMPAKGMCMSCSDDEIAAIVKYMADVN